MGGNYRVGSFGFAVGALLALLSADAFAQAALTDEDFARNHLIVPQWSAMRPTAWAAPAVQLERVRAGVVVTEQVAVTTLDIELRNPGAARAEARMLLPVPDGAVVRGFDFQGAGAEPSAEILRIEEARATYDRIVAQIRDPAILEFAGYQLLKTSVFPVEPGGTQRVRLTYEHVLPAEGERVDYVLPRSESLGYTVPWEITVSVRSKRGVSTMYSPSHELEVVGKGGESGMAARAVGKEPGSFRLSWLIPRGDRPMAASLFAYPDPSIGGGYFLLFAGIPEKSISEVRPLPRELTVVLDRSGSMRGEKLEQAKEAARQIIAGLDERERFNLIAYDNTVQSFSDGSVEHSKANEAKAFAWLDGIRSCGGTNIHDALYEALRPAPAPGYLPIVLFITDGLPTVGRTREAEIRRMAADSNKHGRRIFTVGVGVDINTPLLERIADQSRAVASFVLPGEDVEARIAGVARRLRAPVLAGPSLTPVGKSGTPEPGRIRDVLPAVLPDLFAGDQLVVLGQYVGAEPLGFVVSGRDGEATRSYSFRFELSSASTRNAFVPRLWAGRKVAQLVDAIRDLGQEEGVRPDDPRLKELTGEVVAISREFGVLTEYTAFLALEGTDLAQHDAVLAQALGNFQRRAMQCRSGLGSVNQSMNGIASKQRAVENLGNVYYDENMNKVQIAQVRQVGDRAFYQRGGRWMDSKVVAGGSGKTLEPTRTVMRGTPQFAALLDRLTELGREGSVSLSGSVLLEVDGEIVLVMSDC